jgi:hypothetical protein
LVLFAETSIKNFVFLFISDMMNVIFLNKRKKKERERREEEKTNDG